MPTPTGFVVMEPEPLVIFVKQVLLYLLVPFAFSMTVIWFPWHRVLWLPNDPEAVERTALRLLRSGRTAEAMKLLRIRLGLSERHATMILTAASEDALKSQIGEA